VPAIRLQKLLSAAGVASRRAAEALITDGRVTVNGMAATRLGSRADPVVDEVRVDGRRIRLPERRRYILLNKPAGYVTTRTDPQRRRTVLALIPDAGQYLYPVGRLDYESEGLLIITNDGDLTAALTHPRHGVAKVYEATVRKVPDARALERLRHGVVLDGRRTAPAQVRVKRTVSPGRDPARAVLEITLREGRQRQVRRMCEAVGHPVERLTRIRIGPLSDARLKPGMWRELSEEEVRQLREAAGAGHASTGPVEPRASGATTPPGSAARGPGSPHPSARKKPRPSESGASLPPPRRRSRGDPR
jgi:pseudouridine synthase